MFKLAFALGIVLILWLQSLFALTERVDVAGTQIYRYSWVAWFFLSLTWLLCIACAEFARRAMKDRIVAGICLLGIPLFGLVSLGFLYDRVELSDQLLRHRRAPPHTRFNIDIPWDTIESVTRVEREQAGWTGPSGEITIGYQIRLKDGMSPELPSNEVLTAASSESIASSTPARSSSKPAASPSARSDT
ncbi:hypothetical protein AYO47_07225 [Planctomyces sp. SCGC AG-212-M04]|nr:hypothetical protein AYO47_07225 [Planctomyces sp. SCGC AG-212-M04]